VALADPAADWPGCLIALGASARISGVKGQRSELVQSFIQSQYQTSLTPEEIIVGSRDWPPAMAAVLIPSEPSAAVASATVFAAT
jgi:CO/xanthine dehydrogenase FAD-binding subunit